MTKISNDGGNVVVEYIAIALFLIVPILWIAVQCSIVARTYLEVVSISNSAARVYALQSNDKIGLGAVKKVLSEESAVSGIQLKRFSLKVKCSNRPCLVPGNFVTVSISGTKQVSFPFFSGISIPIRSSQTIEVGEAR